MRSSGWRGLGGPGRWPGGDSLDALERAEHAPFLENDDEATTPVSGGGVLIFDEYGRLKFHVHNDVFQGAGRARGSAICGKSGQLEARTVARADVGSAPVRDPSAACHRRAPLPGGGLVAVAKTPSSVEIRAYQVGFGDCFLVTFVYDATDRRSVLIDFGTTELPAVGGNRLQPSKHMPLIANEIQKDCEGRLTAVVATHRHADHISGFATDSATGKSGEIIKQPEAEAGAAAVDRGSRRQDRRDERPPAIRAAARRASRRGCRPCTTSLVTWSRSRERPPAWMSAALAQGARVHRAGQHQEQVRGGEPARHGRGQGARAVWAHHGSPSGLDALLPGVKVHVLGPAEPGADREDPEAAQPGSRTSSGTCSPVHDPSGRDTAGARPRAPRNGRAAPVEARWFRERSRPHARRAAPADRAHPRQSDEQHEPDPACSRWAARSFSSRATRRSRIGAMRCRKPENAAKTRALLADVDVYKVGHHGSLNATPKDAVVGKLQQGKEDQAFANLVVDAARQARQGSQQDGGSSPPAP